MYPNQISNPIPKLPERVIQNERQTDLDLDLEINRDIEENSPYQEGIISEIYQRPHKSQLVDPPELTDLVNTERIVQRYLPKQADIDKILNVIQRKVLKGTHLPITIREIQAGYLNSPYFKDLYLYLSQNKMPSSKGAMHKIEALSEKYILLDSLLFKLNIEKEKAVLAIPEICVDQMIALYHSSLFAGHQGVVKTYLTLSDKFFIPDLMHYLRSYIKACHICQLSNKDKFPNRHFQRRINLNYKPLTRLNMDLKVMPKSYRGHKFILCVIDEMTNYLITIPIYQARSEEIGDSLIDDVISKFGIPEYLSMDQDSSFMATIMVYLFRKLNIKIKTVAPFNHKSLQAEHGIKSLSTILTKHLTEQGQMWPKYLPLATLAHNTFNSPNLANYSPYELMFGQKPKVLIDIETDPDIKVLGNFTEYYKLLEKQLRYLHEILQQFKSKHLAMINNNCKDYQHNSGILVYIISPITSQLRTNSRKVTIKYIGPLVIYKIVDPHNYLLMTLDGKILRGLFEFKRIKPATLRTSHGNVNTLAQLKQVLSLGIIL